MRSWRREEYFIIREVEVYIKEGKRREAVENLFKVIGAKANIEDIKRIGGEVEEEGETIVVRLENAEQRKEIMGKKRNLKGRRERITKDWTWRQRKMRWRLEKRARMEEKNGRRFG